MPSHPELPEWLERAFERADASLCDQLVAELAHDRISITTTEWWPLRPDPAARALADAVPYAGAFVASLEEPAGGQIEVALFENAATSLEDWLARRDELRLRAPHGGPFTALLLDPNARRSELPESGPTETLRSFAGRLMDRWVEAFDGRVRVVGSPAWKTKVLDLPVDGTLATHMTEFDARLAQLLSEPLGALLFTVPVAFASSPDSSS